VDEGLLEVLRSIVWYDHARLWVDLHARLRESQRLAAEDGETVALSVSLFRAACRFLRGLPKAYPPPDITVLANGEVSLDWHRPDGGMVTVMMLDETTLIYSSLWEGHQASSVVKFSVDVPVEIVDELRALY
jgi:hypothetical protein